MANFDWQKTYPTIVSRTLDPTGKSLTTIVGLHDKEITDADINLIQDLQDYKRQRLLSDQVTSGCLTYSPFQFTPLIPNTFLIPSFDILFFGEVITIQGNNSSALTLNSVVIPPPVSFAPGQSTPDASIYIAFVEVWYQALNPQTGSGYYTDPISGLRYFFPYGGINPFSTNATVSPDDSIDPFQGLFTTERAQIQWRINVQPVALTYDFTKYQFGLDPGALPTEIVYAQASQAAPLNSSSIYQFTNMGNINGDTGVWRAGDGYRLQSAGTMDGYSYAFPLAVIFQRNTGNFDIVHNLWGCADPNPPFVIVSGQNGLLSSGISGRFDSRLADQVFPDNVVDTRSTVNLQGWDADALCRYGFGDLVQGKTQLALARGDSAVSTTLAEAVGSSLGFYASMAPSAIGNTYQVNPAGWDGFSNGFSSDVRTFTSTVAVSINQKTIGTNGSPWVSGPPQGDAFTISLPATSQATITSVNVTCLNNSTGILLPAALLQGQVTISGLNSTSVTVQLVEPLATTPFDPQSNNIYVTIGVTYPAGTTHDLHHTPYVIDGGLLTDGTSSLTMPVYGISEYEVQSSQPALQAFQVWAVNPEYSDVIFGTKIWLQIAGSSGTQQTIGGSTVTTFIINRENINQSVDGLYATRAWDLNTGQSYTITNRVMNAGTHVVTVQNLPSVTMAGSTVVFSMLAQNTAQLAYNAPVRGVTEIDETVLFGNYSNDPNFVMDPRVTIAGVPVFNPTTNSTTFVLAANGCEIKGIAGDDVQRLIWVSDNSGSPPTSYSNLTAIQLQNVSFSNGIITAVAPGDLHAANVFFVGSILPAFSPSSQLIVEFHYVPYQGEGVLNRDYEFVHAEDNALVTTNGTGSAPIVGLKDIYPYNRELPIITMMPAQGSWNDAGLTNSPLATFFDSNFVAMRVNNVEHTFLAPMHTNDFIPPVDRDIRKTIRPISVATGGRGFATAIPHLGYAIAAPTPRTVLGQNLQSTTAPITLFVNNATGSDSNDGLSPQTAKFSILAAVRSLPPVLRDPCTVQLADTGISYLVSNIATQGGLETIATGDGVSQSLLVFALANLSRVVQDEGRLVISIQAGSTNQAVIDATGYAGSGSGPTYAFYIDTSRVVFSGIKFMGFQNNEAIKAKNADVQFVNCTWQDNLQAASYEEACGVVIDGGSIILPNSGSGHVGQGGTTISATGVNLAVDVGASPFPFYTVLRGSSLSLQTHGTGGLQETNIIAGTIVAQAELNSSVVVTSDFQTAGNCVLEANSVLAYTVTVNSFLGGIVADATSNTVTKL